MNQPFFEVGVLVQDIGAAQEELSRALGVTWTEPITGQHEGWETVVTCSHEGPPHLKLMQGEPGSPWDASDGPRIDHIGYWAADLDAATDAAERQGMALEVDGRPTHGLYVYTRGSSSGLRVEMLAESFRPAFHELFGLRLPPERE